MPTLSRHFDWSQQHKYDWESPEGIVKLTTLVQPHLPYVPREFQLHDSACILNGQDVLCITATGDGKSALIYMPALARPEMITVVVEPTNVLESDIAASLQSKGLTSVVINAETLEDARKENRDLWAEARDCRYQVVTTSPENLHCPEFNRLIQDKEFRARWGVLAVDEAHLTDDWGADFRKAYADIWTLRSRGPDHLTVLAMSATIEKGRQLQQVTRCLGFQPGTYHLDKRDCERHNVDYIFRNAAFSFSGHEFRDLDWLVPEHMTRASDLDKTIIYCDTIEQGHRVTLYLRQLLPRHLRDNAYTIIRHMHSMNCPDCKREGLEALHELGPDRKTALFVATAVWEVGLDIPDIIRVILFLLGASISSLVQRAGRPVRKLLTRGEAIVYVKQSDIAASLEYMELELDDRALQLTVVVNTELVAGPDVMVEEVEGGGMAANVGASEVQAGSASEDVMLMDRDNLLTEANVARDLGPDVPDPSARPALSMDVDTAGKKKTTKKAAKKKVPKKTVTAVRKRAAKKTALPHADRGKGNTSILLVIAAHARCLCIQQQINIIYDNPNIHAACGRCSSCVPRPIPVPRILLPSHTPSSDPQTDETQLRETLV